MAYKVKTVERKESNSTLFKLPKEPKFKEYKEDNSFEEDKLGKDAKKLDSEQGDF